MNATEQSMQVVRACDTRQWDSEGRRIPLERMADRRARRSSDHAPAVVFDRDGVLNVDRGYVHRRADFVWAPQALAALRWLSAAGVDIFVATNQGGIGLGLYTEAAFKTLTEWMLQVCADHAAHVSAVYYCPHHPDAVVSSLRVPCHCRKPRPGQIEAAIVDHGLAREDVIFVGDSDGDMAAGGLAGVRTAKYAGGSLLDLVVGLPIKQGS